MIYGSYKCGTSQNAVIQKDTTCINYSLPSLNFNETVGIW